MSDNNTTLEDLLNRYSSQLGRSMIVDVFREAQSDPEQAYQILSRFVSQEPSAEDINRYLIELDNFVSLLGKEVVINTLKGNKWDTDKTIVELFPLLEQKQKEDRKKKREQEREQTMMKAKERASVFMKEFYTTVSEAKIHQLLEENDGDVNATVEMIMNMEDERERKFREEERIRLDKIEKCNALAARFNKSVEEVEKILNEHNWDMTTIVNQLLKAEQDTKFQRMLRFYNYRRPDEVRHALETHDYDEPRTIKFLDEKIQKEILDQERRAKELREKKEAERRSFEETQRKQQEELNRLQQINQQKAKEAELKLLEERKLLEQLQQEEECLRLENEKREIDAQLAREKEEEIKKLATHQEDLLRRSMYLADQIQQEVAELEHHFVLRVAIENKIRETGPTFLPHTPQQETPLVIHQEPEICVAQQIPLLSQQLQDVNEPIINTSSTNDTQSDIGLVRLVAYPSRVDYGDIVNLTWEFTHSPANPSNWIGLYKEGAQSKDYEKYEWAPTQSGSITFMAPSYTGKFFFRFLFNRTYTCWGISNCIEVGPMFKMTPSLSENRVTLKVHQNSGQVCPNAWVAMYEPNRDHRNYYTYNYLPKPPTEVSFKIPKAGNWEFRLFPQRSYFVADTCQVEFKGSDELFMELDVFNNQAVITHNIVSVDPYYDNVWVGIYHIHETDIRQYRRYKRVNVDKGKLILKAIQTPGSYEARLFANGSPKIITKSNTVVVFPKIK